MRQGFPGIIAGPGDGFMTEIHESRRKPLESYPKFLLNFL
ncbi:hypothetical protein PAMC26577_07945 [Caballeronia sordidicola]|uniref:Uncharacterized protein n=1 Tax=Caballeronia sordidicola TaxID=196367 RepID=A0A242N1W6_CABSO|nr:hypothetical protein PAMC26577_07945 [Caballeronia sordidicola]